MGHVTIIAGSPSATSRLSGLLRIVETQLVQEGYDVTWVNVRDLPAEDLVYARTKSPAILATCERLEKSAGVVVGTPVYKAAYTGLLKTYLDLLPEKILSGKVVLPVTIAGTMAHLLAMEYALKPVLSVLGASECLKGVFALEQQVTWTDSGAADVHPDVVRRLTDAIQEMTSSIRRNHAAIERALL
ncbi:NADPH-dependent FMN reductase [Alicyclobacillus macrosporangiidus]|jgi:FMN reductase|uniref:FMN reductase n=1 Tax=Alicyclobacillus macrosporangiidus TaxID=392015 RepID=A0A1I7JQE7_9BACL|nr:NADPH-dependent FMN reductase [Alicyclobacillus macrosporangiidus]SFU87368.1 FMN reductase [Alicyclobacillus macrosporangiidus]